MIKTKDYKSYLDKTKKSYIEFLKFTLSLPAKQCIMLNYLIDASGKPWAIWSKKYEDYFQVDQEGYIDKILVGWSWYLINSALNELKKADYIYKEVENINMRNHTVVKLNTEKIEALRVKNLDLVSSEFLTSQDTKTIVNEPLNNEYLNNESLYIYSKVDDVNMVDVIEIVDYLNSKAKTNFKASTETTKKHIKARINEGFIIDDFKKVIDNKCNNWIGTEFEKYLRPSTLFGNKFESYLNEKPFNKSIDPQSKVKCIKFDPTTDKLSNKVY